MIENQKSAEVFIQREGRVFRWGQAAYFRTWNGLKETVSAAALKAVALPLAVVIGILTFLFSGKKDLDDSRGQEMNVPGIIQDLPIVDSPFLNGREPLNRITQPRVSTGVTGNIRVFNLSRTSQIPVGSEAKAILESGASNGIVKARLLSALKVDGEIVLPERTTLFGRGKSTEERLFVQFERAIFPSGESFRILGQAFDIEDKILGLKGAFVGTRSKKMGMAIGFGVLGGIADGLQTNTSGSNMWGPQEKRSMRDASLSGASKAAIDQSQALMEQTKSAPNIIEVKRGTEFYLIIDEPKQEEK